MGADELIADSVDDYVQRAITLANDPERIVAWRTNMRERLQASPCSITPDSHTSWKMRIVK